MSIAAVADGFQKGMFQVISPGASQALAISGVSNQSNAHPDGTSIIRLFSTTDCWIAFGTNPTAVKEAAGSMFLPAGIVEYFECRPVEKIAVIQDSASGKLYLTEGATS